MPALDQIEILDGRISDATKAANAKASKAKSTRAKLWDLLVGGSEKARELHDELTALQAEQAFEETRIAALAEHRARLAAEKAAADAAAEKAAKIDAFRAHVALQSKAAQRVDDLITKLAAAANELSAATTYLQVAASTVGLPRAAVDGHESIRDGIDASLRACGAFGFLFTFNPKGRLDAQGRPNSATISDRVERSGSALLAMLPREV